MRYTDEGSNSANRGGQRNRKIRPKPDNEDSRAERERPAKPDRQRSEYVSPKSFLEAWKTSFFTPAAILMVTTLGLVVDCLPRLHKMPIGGRLAIVLVPGSY